MSQIKTSVVLRHGTEWDSEFIPKKGEVVIYDRYDENGVEVNQSVKFKIGDGVSKIDDLPFSGDAPYQSDFKVTEKFGKYAANSTIPATGKTAKEVIQDAFCSDKQPSITNPTASLAISLSKTSNIEFGDKINITYQLNTNAGSYTYGPATGVTFNTPQIIGAAPDAFTENAMSHTTSNYVVKDLSTTFSATASIKHTDGVEALTQLENNSGNKITANTITGISNSKTISIVYPIYTGTIASGTSITAGVVSNLTKSLGSGIPSSKSYTTALTCPVIAYPSSFGELKVVDSNNFTQAWSKSTVTITIGKNGATKDITYNVYVGGASTMTETYKFSKA